MEYLLDGLAQIGQIDVMIALVVGAIAGVVIGAIPGLGPAVGIAILPTTFKMEPLVGLTLLLGIYSGAWYGGAKMEPLVGLSGSPTPSAFVRRHRHPAARDLLRRVVRRGAIPAIINTPGTVVSVLTTFDGYPITLLRSAGFGVSMGILPGVGEFIAQFFSYSTARRFSKTPELFGKGAPEGLIACETSNNAVPASALVPLLALGIPGEALTAMMLAVFMVHNYVPGPTLFETRPEFIGGLYLSLFFMNIVILLFLLVATRWIVLVTRLEPRTLGVSVLALSLVGTYTQNYRLSDCVLAVAFGILGYALKRCNLPIVPIVLGVVLGPILESRIRQSLGISSGDLTIFVTRPISAVLLFAIAALLAGTAVAALRRSDPSRPERIRPR